MAAVAIEAPPRMTEAQAAEYLGVKPGTLAVWRCVGRHGIPYHKIGRLVRYSRADLDAWLEQRRHSGTSTGELATAG